jgi:predicted membrane-bound spermidine synthase
MQKKLLFLSFIEGATVMAAELCGAKLLSPVFGSSLYVWASVMGITLAALAIGYFFGGWISSRKEDQRKILFRIMNLAALFILLMPVIAYYGVPRISYLTFIPGVVISTISLLFLPVFFLGTSSPLFISVQTADDMLAGRVSGTVYAVSTVGGILATFICGFYLIPELGLNFCLILFGILLFVTNLIVFKSFRSGDALLFAGFLYLGFQLNFKKNSSLITSDGMLGHLEVQDVSDKNNKRSRILTINNIIQTEMVLETKGSASTYINLIDSLIPNSKIQGSALVLGLGGGLTANLLERKNYQTDGVELDKRIIEAAQLFFNLDKRVNAVCTDARYFLNHTNKRYDVVIVDIFKAEEHPSHVFTRESLVKLKENLSDSGLILVNWHGYLKEKKGLGTKILYNTFVSAGYKLKLCSYSSDEDHRNIIFVASLGELPQLPYEINEEFPQTALVNTDDHPRLEKYNAEANKAWRTNYLRYYQDQR